MAYPDEPPRARDAPAAAAEEPSAASAEPSPPETASTAAPGTPRGHAAAIVVATFLFALGALLAAYLAFAAPGNWFSAASTASYTASTIAVAVGKGVVADGALVIRPADASGTVIVTVPVNFRASDYPGVAWSVTGLPAGTEARLLWRSEFKPGRTYMLEIPVEGDRLAAVVAAHSQDWIGPINGLGLALRFAGDEPVRIAGVTIDTMSAWSLLRARLRDWTMFENWSGTSINTVVGGADLQELPLPALFGIAAIVTVVVVALIAWRRPQWLGAGLPVALAAVLFAAWFVLDARWQWNLVRQARFTATAYAGKDWHEKHVVAEDGLLFTFIEKVRAKLPPQARVFMLSDAPYFRGRGAYHLYPYNVWFDPWRNALPPAAALHPGDYVVVFQRPGVQFDTRHGVLRLEGGAPIAAEALVIEPSAGLFRIR